MVTGSIFFDLKITNATWSDTLLLYALGEDLLVKDRHINRFIRLSADSIRIEVIGFTDAMRATSYLYNQLRMSKNYMAHTCSVKII